MEDREDAAPDAGCNDAAESGVPETALPPVRYCQKRGCYVNDETGVLYHDEHGSPVG
jgi:hypothetical protein